MKKRVLSLLLALTLAAAMALPALAADDVRDENYYYFTDRNGNEMMAPKNAFAIRVVEFTPGDPWTSHKDTQDPEVTLGLPSDRNLCLGFGGVLILEFSVAIYDGEGDDIYVFEVGGDVEATNVAVSNDLVTWYDVGDASGKTAGVDLAGKVPENSRFKYVKLTDLKEHNSSWPGADIAAVSGLNTKAITSTWAEDEVSDAEALDLIPDSLKDKDMTQPITRAEFAGVSVKVYENLGNTTALPAVVNPFSDTNDLDVLKALNAGVTNGTGDGTTFSPDDRLNREQCATMLTRVFKRSTMPGWTLDTDGQFTLTYTQPAPFADDLDISGWARDSVYFMVANNIINGVGGNKFAPKNTTSEQEAQGYANATREQALAIAVRMVQNLK